MKKFLSVILAFAALIPAQAFAMDLTSAKQSGLVGEKPDGLIAAVAAPSGEINALVAETNQGRMGVYIDTASKQGIPVSQVQAVAAQKLYELTAPGQYVMTNGQWVKK